MSQQSIHDLLRDVTEDALVLEGALRGLAMASDLKQMGDPAPLAEAAASMARRISDRLQFVTQLPADVLDRPVLTEGGR